MSHLLIPIPVFLVGFGLLMVAIFAGGAALRVHEVPCPRHTNRHPCQECPRRPLYGKPAAILAVLVVVLPIIAASLGGGWLFFYTVIVLPVLVICARTEGENRDPWQKPW